MTILSRFKLLCCSLRIYSSDSVYAAAVHLEAVWNAETKYFKTKLNATTRGLATLLFCYFYSEEVESLNQERQELNIDDVAERSFRNDRDQFATEVEELITIGWLVRSSQRPEEIHLTPSFYTLLRKWKRTEWLGFGDAFKLADRVNETRAYTSISTNKFIQNQFIQFSFLRDLTYAAAIEGEPIALEKIDDPVRIIYQAVYKNKQSKILLLNLTGCGASWVLPKSLLMETLPVLIQFSRKNIHFPRYHVFEKKSLEHMANNQRLPHDEYHCLLTKDYFNAVLRQNLCSYIFAHIFKT